MDEDVDSFKNLVSTIKLDEHLSSVLYRNPVFSNALLHLNVVSYNKVYLLISCK